MTAREIPDAAIHHAFEVTGYSCLLWQYVRMGRAVFRESEALQTSQLRDMLTAIRKMEEKWGAWRQFNPEDAVLRSLVDCRVRLEHALNLLEE